MRKYFLLLVLSFFMQPYLYAQKELNGLTHRQDEMEIPVSSYKPSLPEKKASALVESILVPAGDGDFIISGGWFMTDLDNAILNGNMFSADYDYSSWFHASVPGTVLTTLVDQGIYADPYYGLNNMYIPDTLSRMQWCYRTVFGVPRSVSGKRFILKFEGINYKSAIYLNGKYIGNTTGAFRRAGFDISDILDFDDKNILIVRVIPPDNPGIPHEQSARSGFGPNGGLLCMDGPTFISSEGWDWMPGIRDRNTGIWQDVKIEVDNGAGILDPQVITDSLDKSGYGFAGLRLRLDVDSKGPMSAVLKVRYSGTGFERPLSLEDGVNNIELSYKDIVELGVKDPELWWPNGYGTPHLYEMELILMDTDRNIMDTRSIKFGIRTLEYEFSLDTPEKAALRVTYDPLDADRVVIDNMKRRQVESGVWVSSLADGADMSAFEPSPDDKMGPYLVIKVNGVRIFCKGGNWGMDDAMKRVSRDRLVPAFEFHKRAGLNMIRNWTGESTEEVFYTLCDEYGMMVWNDFWYSTEGTNRPPVNEDLFLDNVRDVVKRFRNHPSIVIWCPRNEGYASPYIDKGIAEIVHEIDGTRHYHGNSRNLNIKPSGKWSHFRDKNEYFVVRGHGFNTEIGAPSIPTAETMVRFIPESDRWPISDTWFYHDYVLAAQGSFNKHMKEIYGTPESLDEYCSMSQFMNYDSYRAIIEGYNANMWDNASGALYWMSHPAWPSMVWQLYSWDYETPASYFGAAKACEPVHIQWNNHDYNVVVVNTTLIDLSDLTVEASVYALDGRHLAKKEISCPFAGANSRENIFKYDYPAKCQEAHILRLLLKDRKGRIMSLNDYLRPGTGESNLYGLAREKVELEVARKNKGKGVDLVRISNKASYPAYGVKLNAIDESGNIVLPAYFSDGYFNLLPGETRDIQLEGVEDIRIMVSGYNVKTGIK